MTRDTDHELEELRQAHRKVCAETKEAMRSLRATLRRLALDDEKEKEPEIAPRLPLERSSKL